MDIDALTGKRVQNTSVKISKHKKAAPKIMETAFQII
jgi:hypothetical protein